VCYNKIQRHSLCISTHRGFLARLSGINSTLEKSRTTRQRLSTLFRNKRSPFQAHPAHIRQVYRLLLKSTYLLESITSKKVHAIPPDSSRTGRQGAENAPLMPVSPIRAMDIGPALSYQLWRLPPLDGPPYR